MGERARSLNFKSLFYGLLVLFAFGLGTASAEKVKDLPKPTSYVTDLAGVLSDSEKAQINQLCGQVDREAKAQIAVVIINTLEDASDEEFSNDLFHTWKIGDKGDRGVLLFFATKEHKRRIEVGYGLEGILPDGKVGDIGRSMVSDLQQNNWDNAVYSGVGQIAQVIATDANVTLDVPQQPVHHYRRESAPQGKHFNIFPFIILAIIILGLIRRGGGGGGMGGWLPWFLLGNLMGGGGGRGGWGGGGRDGDGGGRSDGGFGGFGGGDSGGGGASGDW